MAIILPADNQNIEKLARMLQKGECIAFPTETVYGLGADATNNFAVEKIFQYKKRPTDNPLIVHFADKKDIAAYAHISHPLEQLLIDRLMPGPFTIILQKKDSVADAATSHLPYVAVRVPDHVIAHKLLLAAKLPIAAPSANRSGRPSPTNAEMVQSNFSDIPLYILDGGPCAVGIESTVVRIVVEKESPHVQILRPGYITDEDIRCVVGPDISVNFAQSKQHLSPGTRYTHYAPSAHVHIIDIQQLPTLVGIDRKKIGLLATQEFFTKYDTSISSDIQRYVWGSRENLATCAQSLFASYHSADKDSITDLYVEGLPEQGIGYAIMNRVRKSAI